MLLQRLILISGIGAAVAAADVLAKVLAEAMLSQGAVVVVTPFLNLRLGFNPGVSFGLLPMTSAWGIATLVGVQAVIIAAMLVLALRSGPVLERTGLGLMIGGAVGNIIDRVRDGLVTDFVDLHLAGWHWPSFNLADMAITSGASLLLWSILRPNQVQISTG